MYMYIYMPWFVSPPIYVFSEVRLLKDLIAPPTDYRFSPHGTHRKNSSLYFSFLNAAEYFACPLWPILSVLKT